MPQIPATGGRPKTPQGHIEDAILFLVDARNYVAEAVNLRQKHYREERDLLTRLDESLRNATLSTRYSELQEDMQRAAIA